jgi:hypothetical protein
MARVPGKEHGQEKAGGLEVPANFEGESQALPGRRLSPPVRRIGVDGLSKKVYLFFNPFCPINL